MPARRRLKADYQRTDLDAEGVDITLVVDTYNGIGSISKQVDDRWHFITLTDQAMDDLYEALKAREAHKQFLAAKYGANA